MSPTPNYRSSLYSAMMQAKCTANHLVCTQEDCHMWSVNLVGQVLILHWDMMRCDADQITCSLINGSKENRVIGLLAVGGKVGVDNIWEGLHRRGRETGEREGERGERERGREGERGERERGREEERGRGEGKWEGRSNKLIHHALWFSTDLLWLPSNIVGQMRWDAFSLRHHITWDVCYDVQGN